MGVLFAFLSALSFAVANLIIRTGMNKTGGKNNGFIITVLVNLVVVGAFFLISLAMNGFSFQFSWTALMFFVLGGLLTTGLGRLTLFESIQRINSSRASAIKNGAPIFTVIFALILLDERISFVPVIGMLLVTAAILLQGILFFRQSRTETAATAEHAEARRTEWAGYLIAVTSALLFGIGQVVRKQGLLVVNDAFFGALIGVLTSLAFIIVYESIRGRLVEQFKQSFKHVNAYFIWTGILTSLGPTFFFLGASLTQVSYVSVITAAEPLLTVLLSALYFKGQEQLTPSVWVSAALILAGTTLIAVAS